MITTSACWIKRLQQFRDFRLAMGWDVNTALGWLCNFWSEVNELAEERGNITGWSPEYLCELTNLSEEMGAKLWDALLQAGWVETMGEKVVVKFLSFRSDVTPPTLEFSTPVPGIVQTSHG